MIKGKKADATDPFIILIVIAFLAISFIIVIFVNSKLSLIIQNSYLNQSEASDDILNAFDNVNAYGVQQGFAIILGIMLIFVIISAFLVRQHPIFIFINIIFLIVTLFVAILLSNVYGKMMDNETLLVVMEQQTVIHYVMTHLVRVMLGVGALNMVILFSKIFGPPQGGGDFG